MAFAQSGLGIGNRLQLPEDELLANLGDIQIRNGLGPSPNIPLNLLPVSSLNQIL